MDPTFTEEAIASQALDDFSFVSCVLAADAANLNDVTKMRVMLHNTTTKALEERVVSKAAFGKLNGSTKAWRSFVGKGSKKSSEPCCGELLVPPDEAPPGQEAPRRLRRAETVLSQRTGRILLVLECCTNSRNEHAVLRSAECLGVQNVWIINAPGEQKESELVNRNVSMKADDWLTIRTFDTTKECINALRAEKWDIWATDLTAKSVCLDRKSGLELPPKIALVAGREESGVSEEMLQVADKRVFLPIYGFADSFNLSVAMSLLIQRLFYMYPEARGSLSSDEKHQLRIQWYTKLAKGGERNRKEYARYINHPPLPLDDLRDPNKEAGNKGIMRSRKRINKRNPGQLTNDPSGL